LINVADLDLYLKVASVNKGQPYPNKVTQQGLDEKKMSYLAF